MPLHLFLKNYEKMNENFKKIYGTWVVKTEGDVEGRSIITLGTFTGFVDEIALYLANQCRYTLRFEKTELVEVFTPQKEKVHVKCDFDSEISKNIETEKRLLKLRKVFSDRPVNISKSNFYNSFVIESKKVLKYKK